MTTDEQTREDLLRAADHAQATEALRPAGAFRPTALQKDALAVVSQRPELATKRKALAAVLGCTERTVFRWFADMGFVRWWGMHCRDIAHAMVGPAALELVSVISDPRTLPHAKTKATEALLRVFGRPKGAIVEAVTALLEEHGRAPPSRLRVGIEVDTRSVEERPENERASHNPQLSEGASSPASAREVPREAMQLYDPEELVIAQERVRKSVADAAAEGQREALEMERAAQTKKKPKRRQLQSDEVAAPTVIVDGGVVENHGASAGANSAPSARHGETSSPVESAGGDAGQSSSSSEGVYQGEDSGGDPRARAQGYGTSSDLRPPTARPGYQAYDPDAPPRIAVEDPGEAGEERDPFE